VSEKRFSTILIMALCAVFSVGAMAESNIAVVQQANKLYTDGQYNEAIEKYDQVLLDGPGLAEPKFNKANSYYRLDDLEKAIDLYRQAAAETKDMDLVAKAKYNLGNCFYQRGLKQRDSDLQKALEAFQESISSWRAVLDIRPDNEKAAKNIEVARLTIKDIIDQINKQKQQQEKQAQEKQQLQEKLKELLQKQKGLAEQTQNTKESADSNSISQDQAKQNYEDIGQQQSGLRQETQQALEQIQQQDPNVSQQEGAQQQKASEELAQATKEQNQAEEQLSECHGASAKQSQDKAAEHIENALKTLSQQQGQQQQQQQQQQQDQQQEQSSEQQQQQEAVAKDTTADDIINKEEQQRKQRMMLQRGGYKKVEKDW